MYARENSHNSGQPLRKMDKLTRTVEVCVDNLVAFVTATEVAVVSVNTLVLTTAIVSDAFVVVIR